MRKKGWKTALAMLCVFCLTACTATGENISENDETTEDVLTQDGNGSGSSSIKEKGDSNTCDTAGASDGAQATETLAAQPEILDFVDVRGNAYQVEIHPDWEKHTYALDGFVHDGDTLSYSSENDNITSKMGVDVSHYQGDIDWEKVKAAGYEFAFIRIGFRGYGESGTLNPDKRYKENLTGALDAGLDVGVYFFSQAVSEEESVEEAEYVLALLEEADISIDQLALPVVFDPENILDDTARTDDVTGEQFTKNAVAFCERIREAGAAPMIYCNMLWEAYKLDLGVLGDYPVWYADYEKLPQTPYAFAFWQYSESAHVDGIPEAVDTDIWLTQ
jgi:GH25 family lysozyme M1 (1,4-beta-N-acetylmuramidase)